MNASKASLLVSVTTDETKCVYILSYMHGGVAFSYGAGRHSATF